MRRLFDILFSSLAMLAVALLSAFITLRLAIHGREVEVPDFANQTVSEAIGKATQARLNISIENRFYSTTTPAGRVLSQLPAPGSKVRRDWTVRISESLGPQRVSVPNVIGQSERTAAVNIRRLALDLGTVAYIPAPGPPGIVLTQTPTPAAAGIDGPRISLLVSEPLPTPPRRPADQTDPTQLDPNQPTQALPADSQFQTPTPQQAPTQPNSTAPLPGSTTPPQPSYSSPANAAATPTPASSAPSRIPQTPAYAQIAHAATPATTPGPAYVMPNLIGLSLSAAAARITSMGLHIASVETQNTPIRHPGAIPSIPSPSPITPIGSGPIRMPAPVAPMSPVTPANTVVAQSPAAGHRVTRTDPIHITLSR